MPSEPLAGAGRSQAWRWSICVLLLLATVVNYMDRLTANTLATEIQAQFHLKDKQYGDLELGFGLAYAAGSLLFGWAVDRMGVYWLYPAVLVGWSAMGYLTGLSRSYQELMALRILLGFFEAGHFPCGLKTIQLLLRPRDRAMGCSLLQSGTALGAVLAPQVIKLLVTDGPGGWRRPFLVIGAGGTAWVALWLLSIRPRDLRPGAAVTRAEPDKPDDGPGFWALVFSPRFLALTIMILCINMNWHIFRVWLPKFLRDGRGYGRDAMLDFTTYYYLAADLGALAAGAASTWLSRRGLSVYASRMAAFARLLRADDGHDRRGAVLPSGPLLAGLAAAGGLRRARVVRGVLLAHAGPLLAAPGEDQRRAGDAHLAGDVGLPPDLRRLPRPHEAVRPSSSASRDGSR